MMIKEVIVQNQSGVHAGIAGALYQVAKEHHVHAFIRYNKKTNNIKDFIKILSLGIKYQEIVTLIVEGENEEQALTKMIMILENKKG